MKSLLCIVMGVLHTMKLFTICPECGYKLGRSEEGTDTEAPCPKCGSLLNYKVKEDKVLIEVLQHSERPRRHIRNYAEKLSQKT